MAWPLHAQAIAAMAAEYTAEDLRAPILVLDLQRPNTAKMLIETLSVAQARIGSSPLDKGQKSSRIQHLQWLIDQIEAQS